MSEMINEEAFAPTNFSYSVAGREIGSDTDLVAADKAGRIAGYEGQGQGHGGRY